jgi:signal peptidase II
MIAVTEHSKRKGPIVSKYRILWIVIVIALCIGGDQMSKAIARDRLASIPPRTLLNGIIFLGYAENPGAFMGMGSNLAEQTRFVLWTVLVSIILAAALIVVLTTRTLGAIQVIGLSLLIGGGTSNLLDRILNNGLVVDFVSIGIGPLRTGILNLADLAITVGSVMVLLFSIKKETPHVDP